MRDWSSLPSEILRNRAAIALFVGFFLSFALFIGAIISDNTTSRLALTVNLVQQGRLDIGGFEDRTGDKSYFNGKYYSDKAPGMSFLAIPMTYAYTRIWPIRTDDTRDRRFLFLVYLCAASTSAVLTALAAAMLFRHVFRATGSWVSGLVASIAYALGTPTWEWATSVFGHATSGALLIIGFVLLDQQAGKVTLNGWPCWRRAILGGVALGGAVAVEFTAAIPVLIIGCYFLLTVSAQQNVKTGLAASLLAGACCALTLLPILLYNYSIFGSPFHLSYSNVVGYAGMKTGFFGIDFPKADVLFAITGGAYRGVLWLSPILAFAVIALLSGLWRRGDRLRHAAILLIVAYYLLLNAGYAYWDGGYSTGPRHITPIFPFMALALGFWLAHRGAAWRAATFVVLAASVAINLACVAVNSVSPTSFASPLTDLILPTFWRGDLRQSVTQIFLGTRGLWQLAPLVVIWLACVFLSRQEPAPGRNP